MEIFYPNWDSFDEIPALAEQPIRCGDTVIGWNATFHFRGLGMYASGTDAHRNTAVAKAYSESMERLFLLEDFVDREKWKFKFLNTTDGMAAGLELKSTVLRSNYEAVERYCRSLLSTGELNLKALNVESELAASFTKSFEEIQCLGSGVKFSDFSGNPQSCYFVLMAGFFKNSVCFGYSVNNSIRAATEQACIEVGRNKFLVSAEIPENYLNLRYLRSLIDSSKQKERYIISLAKAIKEDTGELFLPAIDWQIASKYRNYYVCRSFVKGYVGTRSDGDLVF